LFPGQRPSFYARESIVENTTVVAEVEEPPTRLDDSARSLRNQQALP
jgi:hypothetical protein